MVRRGRVHPAHSDSPPIPRLISPLLRKLPELPEAGSNAGKRGRIIPAVRPGGTRRRRPEPAEPAIAAVARFSRPDQAERPCGLVKLRGVYPARRPAPDGVLKPTRRRSCCSGPDPAG